MREGDNMADLTSVARVVRWGTESMAFNLGHLPAETQRKVVCDNVCRLYDVDASKLPRVQKQAA